MPPAGQGTRKHLYLVYEPVTAAGAVPLIIQRFVGFSHAKLVVLNGGKITDTDASGRVYDISKNGKQEIGYGGERGPLAWAGLRAGEVYRHMGDSYRTVPDIAAIAASVVQRMGTYNLVLRNCEDFAVQLAQAIAVEVAQSYTANFDSYLVQNVTAYPDGRGGYSATGR